MLDIVRFMWKKNEFLARKDIIKYEFLARKDIINMIFKMNFYYYNLFYAILYSFKMFKMLSASL